MNSYAGRLAGLLFSVMLASVLYVHRDRIFAVGAQFIDSVKPAGVQVSGVKQNGEGGADLSTTRDEAMDKGRFHKKFWTHVHDAMKCHHTCGTDLECHSKCPKPWERFVKACEEFNAVKICHDKCASTAERAACEESCPKFANPWLARKLAGFPDERVARMEEKCKIMQKSVACHKACAPGDFQCHHKCPKKMKCPGWHRKEDGREFHHDHHHHHHHHHDWWHHGKVEDEHQRNQHSDAEHYTPHGGWHHHDEHPEHRDSSHGWHEHGEDGWHHHEDDTHDDAVDEHKEFEFVFEIKEVQEHLEKKVDVFQV